jgi:hypothetical protein
VAAQAKRSIKKTYVAADAPLPIRRRWRDYRTASGRSPVGEFIEDLSDSDAAAVFELTKRRLADWRRRGDQERVARGKRPLHL